MLKRILSFIILNMITTTFVFAHHTRMNVTASVYDAINFSKQMQADKSFNQCSDKNKSHILNKLDGAIARAENSDASLEESIQTYQKKFRYLHYKQRKKTRRVLRWNFRVNRMYRRVKKANPEITFNEMVAKMKYSISIERRDKGLQMVEDSLNQAGSLTNYLYSLKEQVLNCEIGKAMLNDPGNGLGITLLILFVGLPVLSILGALFALIMGAFWWALGFFLFAVVMLAALFIWAQVDKNAEPLALPENFQPEV
jgi:exonuclease VII small subunit